LFTKIEKDRGWDEPFINIDDKVLLEIIEYIYRDFRSAIDTLMESIDLLAQEVASMQAAPVRSDTIPPHRHQGAWHDCWP